VIGLVSKFWAEMKALVVGTNTTCICKVGALWPLLI
jgi:hypothetical protein